MLFYVTLPAPPTSENSVVNQQLTLVAAHGPIVVKIKLSFRKGQHHHHHQLVQEFLQCRRGCFCCRRFSRRVHVSRDMIRLAPNTFFSLLWHTTTVSRTGCFRFYFYKYPPPRDRLFSPKTRQTHRRSDFVHGTFRRWHYKVTTALYTLVRRKTPIAH